MANFNTTINSISTPTASHRICLEASFSSLQSPCRQLAIAANTGISGGVGGSSKTSSVAGSLFSRSQLNSILHYDGNSIYDDSMKARSLSAGPSEAATVLLAEQAHRGKSVAFDINRASHPSTNSPSPNVLPKSILHRQNGGPSTKKISTLSFTEPHQNPSAIQPSSGGTIRKIDFLHDDWYGMAPLASPETLSEISSISSRTSLVMNLASSIDKYLHRIGAPTNNNNNNIALLSSQYASSNDDEIFESEMATPKVMRRTPKVSGNLSTCADDWKTVESYKRMGQVFITSPCVPSNNDSSEGSYDSSFGFNSQIPKTVAISAATFGRADNFDYGGCSGGASDVETCQSRTTTMSDSTIINNICVSICPNCPCKSRTIDIECCRKCDHSECLAINGQNILPIIHKKSGDTCNSALSPPLKTSPHSTKKSSKDDNLNGMGSPLIKTGVLESHFPVFSSHTAEKFTEKSSLIPVRTRPVKVVPKKGGGSGCSGGGGTAISTKNKRRIGDKGDDRAFSRNESLPLLANLNDRGSPSSFVKRKKCVYPMESSPRPSPSKKTESSV